MFHLSGHLYNPMRFKPVFIDMGLGPSVLILCVQWPGSLHQSSGIEQSAAILAGS